MIDSRLEGADSKISESRLAELAAELAYPPTPDIAALERRRLERRRLASAGAGWPTSRAGVGRRARLLAGAVAALALLLAVALLVPQTRAALLQIFDIGAIRILADEEPATAVPVPTRLLDLAGETTLAQVADSVDFDVLLPSYPADLGPPDHVYLQRLEGAEHDEPVVIAVWLDPARPDEIALSLYQIALPFYGLKQASLEVIRETRVNDLPAFWVEGPHRLQLQDGGYEDWFFVPGNVLIWFDGQMTYRLESGLSLDEATRIAESLARPE
jgi:hypothetical protein